MGWNDSSEMVCSIICKASQLRNQMKDVTFVNHVSYKDVCGKVGSEE